MMTVLAILMPASLLGWRNTRLLLLVAALLSVQGFLLKLVLVSQLQHYLGNPTSYATAFIDRPTQSHADSLSHALLTSRQDEGAGLVNSNVLLAAGVANSTTSTISNTTASVTNTSDTATSPAATNASAHLRLYVPANDARTRAFFFDDYTDFHAKHRHSPNAPVLIFSPRRKGLGDTIRTLIFAYWTAALSRRVLLIHWNDPFPFEWFMSNANHSTDFFLRLGRLSLNNATASTTWIRTREDYKRFYSIISAPHHDPHRHQSVGLSPHTPPHPFLLHEFVRRVTPWRIDHPKELISLFRDAGFQNLFLSRVVRLSDSMSDLYLQHCVHFNLSCPKYITQRSLPRIASINASFTNPTHNTVQHLRPYVAVHGRLGLGVSEGETTRFRNYSKRQVSVAKCLANIALPLALGTQDYQGNSSLVTEDVLPVFLATDTTSFRSVFQREVRHLSNGRVPVVFGDWNVSHSSDLGKNLSVVGEDTSIEEKNEELKVMQAIYLDLLFLGHARHIITFRSRFSDIAKALEHPKLMTIVNDTFC